MSLNLCPNCQKELKSFRDNDTIEYYCQDLECNYSTSYSGNYNNHVKPLPEEHERDYPGKPKNKKYNYPSENERIYQGKPRPKNQQQQQQQNNNINIEIKKPENYNIKLDNIIGYEGIKRKLRKVINHKGKKKIHILIVGAPGTSKTVFLKSLEDELIPQGCNYHYIDAATMTKRGLLDYIFDTNDIEILAIDEIDKVDKEHQSVFLNMLETGILQTTSFKNIRRKEVKSMIRIATGNYLEDIIEPVRTRFLTFYLKAYTKQQYLYICANMLVKKYDYIDKELANYIAIETYNNIKPINMRDADRIGNLIRESPTKESVKQSIDDLITYSIPDDVIKKLDKQT